MTVKVVGVDLSLTSTGWDDSGVPSIVALPKGVVGVERLDWFDRELGRLANTSGADVIVLEGYSYASVNQAHQSGELGGVARLRFLRCGVPIAIAAPHARAKYATGNGGAGKDAVVASIASRLGDQFDVRFGTLKKGLNDRVDAWVLRQMGLARYSPESAWPFPQEHRKALAKVEWPVLP